MTEFEFYAVFISGLLIGGLAAGIGAWLGVSEALRNRF
jgi:hypothetical protein